MSTRYVYVDETKRAGYVIAAVTVPDLPAAREVVRRLILPGRRRLHMHNEHARHRRFIVSELSATGIEAVIYDAARNYRTDREARAACLTVLIEDLAAGGSDIQLVIEQDDSLVRSDRHTLYRLVREAGVAERVVYRHLRAHEDPLLALPDVVAWCWVRSGEWRRRLGPVVTGVRRIEP